MTEQTEAIDKILAIAEESAFVRPDGSKTTLGVLYDAMLRWAERDFASRISGGNSSQKEDFAVARALCVQDHQEGWNRPVLPPGQPPMIYRVPCGLYRADEKSGTCVDIGSLVGSGPQPLWTYYVEISRRIRDVTANLREAGPLP